MKDLGHEPFIAAQKEFEPLVENPVPQSILDEYLRNDADRTTNAGQNLSFPVVYDSVEPSPYYEGDSAHLGPYIDEKDLIDLPSPSEQGLGQINEPYQKKYYFNP